ncbi:MAG: class I SAM-dependent methyltransferase [Bacteroidia bacterium]|nr:class I SAM-dependent methyltransferase [Bacteroidia bacterium]MDW8334513.1 class I SAM-dependent methyltransferase [Bacteroidia bacterium]
MTESSCPICRGVRAQDYLKCRDHLVTGEEFAIVRCMDCGLLYTHPAPDEKHIERYYRSENYVPHTDASQGWINTLYHMVRSVSVRQKARRVEKTTKINRGRILDYGCGTGAFLAEMRRRGWECTGLEPDPGARQVARHKHGLELWDYDTLWNLPERHFDAVTLWHVLEHVHRLHETTQRLRQAMRDEGVLFIAVPNAEAHEARIYGNYWAAYEVPRHLYHFTADDVEHLARLHDLRIVQKKLMPFDAFYVSILSEKYRKGFWPVGIWNGLLSNVAAVFNVRRSSSLLYVLKKRS